MNIKTLKDVIAYTAAKRTAKDRIWDLEMLRREMNVHEDLDGWSEKLSALGIRNIPPPPKDSPTEYYRKTGYYFQFVERATRAWQQYLANVCRTDLVAKENPEAFLREYFSTRTYFSIEERAVVKQILVNTFGEERMQLIYRNIEIGKSLL